MLSEVYKHNWNNQLHWSYSWKSKSCKDVGQSHLGYKWRNTWKKVISVTPTGIISFISKCYDGCTTDRFITEDCHIFYKLQYGDNLMTDKGFNISDLLISKGSQLFQPFQREKTIFKEKLQEDIKNCKNQNTSPPPVPLWIKIKLRLWCTYLCLIIGHQSEIKKSIESFSNEFGLWIVFTTFSYN